MSTKTAIPSDSRELTKFQQEIFVKYFPVVAKVVNSMRGRLPSYADIDELHSAGVAGLAAAVKRIDPVRKDTFDGYLATRVRGAIIDELRSLDYMSRSARNDAKNIEKLVLKLEQKLFRPPTPEEVRGALGVSQKQFDKIMRRTQTMTFVSVNTSTDSADSSAPSIIESIADETASTPRADLERKEMAREIRKILCTLPEKQRIVLDSYYFKGKKLGEIAKEFHLTEARICQIHSQALASLRAIF